MDQDLVRLLVSAGLSLAGFALLGYAAWARYGGSPAARSWMTDTLGGDSLNERMTVLGAPMTGVLCLCAAAMVLPVVGRYIAFLAAPVALLAVVPFLCAMMLFIPLPDVLSPRWARPLRVEHRAARQAMRAAFRRR